MVTTTCGTNTLGDLIRRERFAKGLTQSDLGAIVDLTGHEIKLIETGRTAPAPGIRQLIVEALGMDIERVKRAPITEIPAAAQRREMPASVDELMSADLRLRQVDRPVGNTLRRPSRHFVHVISCHGERSLRAEINERLAMLAAAADAVESYRDMPILEDVQVVASGVVDWFTVLIRYEATEDLFTDDPDGELCDPSDWEPTDRGD